MVTDMNDTTGTSSGGLKGSFGSKGTKVNQIPYGHPYADNILQKTRELLMQSTTGALLLKSVDLGQIPIHVLKGLGEPAFSPDTRVVYLQIPPKIDAANAKLILQFAKALREADQELLGFKAPDPGKDIMEYATVMHAKNMDSITHVCKIVQELTNSSYYADLLDAIDEIGYKRVYQVYVGGGSQEEIFKAYADT